VRGCEIPKRLVAGRPWSTTKYPAPADKVKGAVGVNVSRSVEESYDPALKVNSCAPTVPSAFRAFSVRDSPGTVPKVEEIWTLVIVSATGPLTNAWPNASA
jgi:hypothetical protein